MSKSRLVSRAVALPAVLLAAISLAGCGSKASTTASGASIIKAGTLTVCSDIPYAPFEDIDKSSPSGYSGFDIDLVSDIAQKMNLSLTIKRTPFGQLKSGAALNAGTCDLVASAMSIEPDRAKVLDFSDPYYDAEQSLLVPVGSSIKTITDLAGKKLGVQKETTGETYANEHQQPGETIIGYGTDPQEYQAMLAGQVDALLQDLPVNLEHTKDGKYTVVETYKTGEQYGFAVKKGNTQLLKDVNDALSGLRKDGTYQQTWDKYFKAS
ncbi:ABC transporter substrate-binding protein [Nocardioides ultimimeridianus]